MTSKTKYIVIVLLLLVLATTSVGLSTWNIHYQAIVGDIDFTATEPGTQDSILNRYIYFTPAKDADGNITTTKQSYPIGRGGAEDIFTYIYDANTHTPTVFVPSAGNVKGSDNYPTDLFLADGALDNELVWGIADVFGEIEFKYEYRLIAMPYVSEDYKGKSENFCEITAIEYYENKINVYLTWKNGNNGNNQGENVLVELLLSGGNYTGHFNVSVPGDLSEKEIENITNKISVTTDGGLAVGVNGFTPFPIVTAQNGWVTDAPSNAGVYQCRVTAQLKDGASGNIDTANKAIAKLNSLAEGEINYAAQVTYAILPRNSEMAQIDYSYEKSSATEQQIKARRNLANTMPLAESAEVTTDEDGLHTINGNSNSFYVTYGGVGFEISITSTFATLDGSADVSFPISEYLFTNANALKELLADGQTWDQNENHYYTTYGFSPDPNYQITNPEVHYTILRREISIDSWTTTDLVYNGTAQSQSAHTNNSYDSTFDYSWTKADGTELDSEPIDAGSYKVWASVGENYYLSCVEGAGTLDETSGKVSFDYTIAPKPVDITWTNTDTLVYNGSAQAPTATANGLCTRDGTVDLCTVTVTGAQTNAGTHTATAIAVSNSNYKLPANATTTFTIAKAENKITSLTITGWTYGQNANSPNIQATYTTGVVYTYSTAQDGEYTATVPTNAGTYYIKAEIPESANYLAATATTAKFVIAKAENKITSLTIANWTFGQNANSPNIQATYTTGVVYTYSADGTTFTSAVPTNAGTYTIKAEIPESDNYLSATAKTATFTINKAPNAIVWGEGMVIDAENNVLVGWTFGSAPVAHIAAPKYGDDGVTITYYTTYNATTGECSGEFTPSSTTSAGTYYAKAVSQDSGSNYHGTSIVMSFAVTEPSIEDATVTLGTTTLVYNGTEQTVTVTVTLPSGTVLANTNYTVTYTLEGEETGTTSIKNAGTYTVTITGIDPYKGEVEITDAIVVAKGTYDMSGITFEDVTVEYTGSPVNISISGTLPTGVSVSYVGNGITDVSSVTVTANFTTTDSNYNTPASMTATLTITRKLVKRPVHNGNTYIYNGASQETAITADFEYDSSALTISCTNWIDAGSKNIKFELVDPLLYDWHPDVNATTSYIYIDTVSISPKSISITAATIEFAFDNSSAVNIVANSKANVTGIVDSNNNFAVSYIDDIANETANGGNLTEETISIGNTYKVYLKLTSNNYVWSDAESNTSRIRSFVYKYKTAYANNTYYTIEDALTQATGTITLAGNLDSYVQTSFTKIYGNASYDLSGRKLYVPHTDRGTTDISKVENTKPTNFRVASCLYIPSGITLTMKSSATIYVTAEIAGRGMVGDHGVIMNDGNIVCESGAIYSYGFLKGLGLVEMKSGTTACDVVVMTDYASASSAAKVKDVAFPVVNWSVNNISCRTIIANGAELQAHATIYGQTALVGYNAVKTTIIGKNSSSSGCFFKPSSNSQSSDYIVKYGTGFNCNTDVLTHNQFDTDEKIKSKVNIEVWGNYEDEKFSVTVSKLGQDMSFETGTSKPAPMSHMNVLISQNSKLTVSKSSYVFMCGTSLVVNGELAIEGSAFVAMDYFNSNNQPTICPRFNSFCTERNNAQLIVNGKLLGTGSISGIVDTTTADAEINILHTNIAGNSINIISSASSYKTHASEEILKGKNAIDGIVSDSYSALSPNHYISIGSSDNFGWLTKYGDIIFDYNTNSEDNTTIVSNKQMPYTLSVEDYPEISQRQHYTLETDSNGLPIWYLDKACTQVVTPGTVFYAETRLYLNWTPIEYSISVIEEDGTEINSDTRQFGELYGDLLPSLTKEGFLLSWKIVETDTYISSNDPVSLGSDHTVQAVWEKQGNLVSITFSNPDVGSEDIVESRNSGSKFNSLPSISREHYSFVGWVAEGSTTPITVDSIIPEIDTTYYAQWDPLPYTVTYNANGGNCSTSSAVGSIESAVELPTPSRANYGFIGWYTAASGGDMIGNAGDSYTPKSNITLYAQWKANTYTVTFDSNGGNSVTPSSITVTYDSTYGSLPVPTRASSSTFGITTTYTFNGWWTSKSGGTKIDATTKVEITANQTLYAQWNESTSCIAAGTLITMADGTTKKVEDLKPGDMVLVFNHYKGEFEFMPVIYNVHDYEDWTYYDILYLYFDDGTTIRIYASHCFLDMATMTYVEISNENVGNYIGHNFYAADFDGKTYKGKTIKLIGYEIVNEYTGVYGPTTYGNLNCFAEGLLNIPADNDPFINTFVMNSNLKYDEDLMAKDIETYGLYTYEDFRPYISEDIFNAYNGQYIKVAVGKGYTTFDRVLELIDKYLKDMGYGEYVPTTPPQENTNTTDAVEATLPPPVVTGSDDNSGDGDGDSAEDDTSE